MARESWFPALRPQGLPACGAPTMLPRHAPLGSVRHRVRRVAARAQPAEPAEAADTITAIQKRPLRQASRLEVSPTPRWGSRTPTCNVGAPAPRHVAPARGLSLGLDANVWNWATQELVIAKRELHARILESRQRGSLAAFAAIAPLYGKVALPGDALVHFETFSTRASAEP